MNDTTIQGLTSGETAFAFFFVIFSFAILAWVYRHNIVFNESDKGDPGHKSNRENQAISKAPDFIFRRLENDGIYCEYKGADVMHTTIVNDMVHFFWADNGKEAIPRVSNKKHKTIGLHHLMRKAVKARFEQNSGHVSAQKQTVTKTNDGDFQLIKYGKEKADASEESLDKKPKIELTY